MVTKVSYREAISGGIIVTMKLYVCYGTFQVPGMRSHPCRNAYHALQEAGYEPELVKVHGAGPRADARGRRSSRPPSQPGPGRPAQQHRADPATLAGQHGTVEQPV